MNAQLSADALATAARQLNYALLQSPNLDEAFKTLYAAADERRRDTLEQLERLLRAARPDGEEKKTLRTSAYPTLKWLFDQLPKPEHSAAAVLQEFQRQASFSEASVAVVWGEFAGFLTYLGAVLGVLICVVAMYATFMLPNFSSLYSGFGSELPELTQIAFGGAAPLFAALLFGSLFLVIALAWFINSLRRRLRRYAPVPPRFQRVPLIGPVALAYNQYLWLACARLLATADVPAHRALELAAKRLSIAGVMMEKAGAQGGGLQSLLASDLAVSAQLGQLDEELRFQQDASVDELLTALARCRRRARIVLTICTYFLVAIFVSAMYMPIFSLGSNI